MLGVLSVVADGRGAAGEATAIGLAGAAGAAAAGAGLAGAADQAAAGVTFDGAAGAAVVVWPRDAGFVRSSVAGAAVAVGLGVEVEATDRGGRLIPADGVARRPPQHGQSAQPDKVTAASTNPANPSTRF